MKQTEDRETTRRTVQWWLLPLEALTQVSDASLNSTLPKPIKSVVHVLLYFAMLFIGLYPITIPLSIAVAALSWRQPQALASLFDTSLILLLIPAMMLAWGAYWHAAGLPAKWAMRNDCWPIYTLQGATGLFVLLITALFCLNPAPLALKLAVGALEAWSTFLCALTAGWIITDFSL